MCPTHIGSRSESRPIKITLAETRLREPTASKLNVLPPGQRESGQSPLAPSAFTAPREGRGTSGYWSSGQTIPTVVAAFLVKRPNDIGPKALIRTQEAEATNAKRTMKHRKQSFDY